MIIVNNLCDLHDLSTSLSVTIATTILTGEIDILFIYLFTRLFNLVCYWLNYTFYWSCFRFLSTTALVLTCYTG